MIVEKYFFSGSGEHQLPAMLFLPESAPCLVLQVVHGMTEHFGRYEKFASFLTGHGIAVAGFDLRGHGRNAENADIASLGEGGWAASLEDIHLFRKELCERFPDMPLVMMGFSLGSFLLREYLNKYESPDGAIIMGTGQQPSVILNIIIAIMNAQIKKAGFDSTTPLTQQLSFDTYNQKFKPNRTSSDWLCADETELDAYLADPLCKKHISCGLFRDLLAAMKRTAGKDAYQNWNKNMPILLLSGADDPVGTAGRGVQAVEHAILRAGFIQGMTVLCKGARHDLLHEEVSGNAESARELIAQWLELIFK